MEAISQVSFASALASFVAIIFIIAIGVILLNQQFQKNLYKQQLETEELKAKHQLDLLQSSIAVQENERKRIAQDLHDELGALLAISRMHIRQLEQQALVKPDVLLKELQNIRSCVEASLDTIRRISHELIPPQLEQFGLISTLETIAERVSQTREIVVTMSVSNDLPKLNWAIQIGLYRVLMEMINNTLKHAGANEVHIDLSMEEHCLLCLYQDNGRGFSEQTQTMGLGLKNITGRINALEGSVQMGNQNTVGFSACIKIPLTG